jgi:hypothetical protein
MIHGIGSLSISVGIDPGTRRSAAWARGGAGPPCLRLQRPDGARNQRIRAMPFSMVPTGK